MSVVTTPLHTGRGWGWVRPFFSIAFTFPFADAKVRQEKAGWKRIPTGVKFLKVSRKELSVFAPRRKVFRKIRKVFESFSGVL